MTRNRPTPKKLLITGGAGFIGSHLVHALAARGARIDVLDDLSAPSSLDLPQNPSVRCHVGDVREAAALEQATTVQAPDVIVHLASVVGVEAVLADPERTGSVIRRGTERVVELARRRACPVLFFSTSEVTDTPRSGPRAVYADAKREAEQRLADSGLPVLIVRPFNIVGPGQSAPGMVLPALARAARRGERMPVHGDGRQERSFLHVDDLVETTLALLDAPWRGGCDVVEIGSEERTTIAELARRMGELAGRGGAGQLTAVADQREDLPRRAPDLTLLRSRVGFRPRWGLGDILVQALSGS